MIISRTPLRISFVGGGSDISSYYRYSPGAVVSTAINKYIYIMVAKQFDGRIIVQYSQTEVVKRVSDIQNNLVREAMRLSGIKGGVHVTSISDVPAEGTGLGSSSAYVVGLLNALYAYQGKYVSAKQLAEEACRIEIDILRKPIGRQDQYIAAYGGFQFMQFDPGNTVSIYPIGCSKETLRRLESRLLLMYTGLTRSTDPILKKQNKSMISVQKRDSMSLMVDLARKMRVSLCSNTIRDIGNLLDENWRLKKTMADGITTKQIDSWYAIAKKHGALGGKILGAGGGGFMLLFSEAKNHNKITRSLKELVQLDFRLEQQGSKIIFVD